MSGIETILGQKPTNHLFPFFWQHGESHAVLEEYMEKIAESGMKGVCIEARPHPDFVSEQWWSDMDCIIKKAKELDMKLWILDDSHFPTGYANGKVKNCYPQYLKKYLDMRRFDVQGPMMGARINFSLLKGRPWDKPDLSEEILGVYLAKRCSQRTEKKDPIIADTLTDITSSMDKENRLLTLDIPSGAYSIFVVYVTRKGGEEATKDYLNPLVKEATGVLIEEVYEPHYEHYKQEFGKTILGFFSDEPRFGNTKGTEAAIGSDMPLPWRDGLEEELDFENIYLPLLWVPAKGRESEIRLKYMDLITNLYNENFVKVMGDWCRQRGVWYLGHNIEDNGAHARLGYGTGHYFRGQKDMDMAGIDVIGGQIVPGMNYHHDAFNTGGSNGEFYHYALAKLGSSAAHLDPRKKGRAMCEAFGAYGWNEGLKTMKWIADHLMVRGINYIVPHAFNPKAFPDFDCPPHFYAHGHNPQFRYFRIFSDYMNRICNLFSDGNYSSKVGVFYPAESEWCGEYMPIEKVTRELTEHQISFDIVTRDYLKEATIEENYYIINNHAFEVLIIPYSECIPDDLYERIRELLKNQVRIIFVDDMPVRITGQNDRAMSDKDATVLKLDKLGAELSAYQTLKLDRHEPDLVIGEYEKDNQKIYMLFNENIGDSITVNIDMSADILSGKKIYCYDAFEDKIRRVMGKQGRVRVSLSPYESVIYLVSDIDLEYEQSLGRGMEKVLEVAEEKRTQEEKGMEDVLALEKRKEIENISVPEKWKVSYMDSFSYPSKEVEVLTDKLECIQNIPGWEEKSGTVRYQSEIVLEEAYRSVSMDLGEVFETAEVFVNGVSVGCRICKPYRFDLSDFMKKGVNQLTIEVTNTLGTAIREPLGHYLVIEPFGVQGPVKIEGEKER